MTWPPPPPPPPGQPSWPSSDSGGGRQKWWTGGRVVGAIAIVLVLMSLSAAGGFLAGATFNGVGGIEFDPELLLGDDDGVPGPGSLATHVEPGETLRLGRSVTGELAGLPVEHALVLESSAVVAFEITEADFDSVLVVVDEAGEVVGSDDDSGQGTLSALEEELSAGTYGIRVQSWGGSDAGTYTVEAR